MKTKQIGLKPEEFSIPRDQLKRDMAVINAMDITFPEGYDCLRNDVIFFEHVHYDGDKSTQKFVKVAIPRLHMEVFKQDKLKIAARLWKAKYNERMPKKTFEIEPWMCEANYFERGGLDCLSDKEWKYVEKNLQCKHNSLTMEILWIAVMGLGFRPGVKVPKEDPRWKKVEMAERRHFATLETIESLVRARPVMTPKMYYAY